MSVFRRAGQTASARLRASGSAPGTGLRTARGVPRRVLWTASLVVCLVAASLVWLLTRPDGSDTAGPRVAGSPAQAEGGAGSGTGSVPPPATIVSFTFDDGDITQNLAGRILRAHGMQGTFYINTGPVDAGNPYHMTWAQILGLHRDGNDIGGHTVSHINLADPGISDAVKRAEICRDRMRLLQMGLDPQSFAYPYGGLNEAAKELVASCGYASARSAGSVSPDGPVFAETVPPGDPFATMALDGPEGSLVDEATTTDSGTPLTLDYLQRAVVSAADNGGGWMQVVLHHICVPGVPDFDTCMASEAPIEESAFAAFLDWLQHDAPDGTTVRTVRQVMEDAS